MKISLNGSSHRASYTVVLYIQRSVEIVERLTRATICTGGRSFADEGAASSLSRTVRGKTRPIVWFVSNCQAKSGRQEYVDELSRHIPVDVYGKCGSMNCPSSDDCFARVAEPNYFFYLSFENSLCDDYVTEKLYNALR